MQGTRGQGFLLQTREEERGKGAGDTGMVKGALHCGAQCTTVTLLSDAGKAFDAMAAREKLSNLSTNFGECNG